MEQNLNNIFVEAWRWNVNPTWTHFSAMIQEAYVYQNSTTQYEQHRASKACLYFGIAAVEAFKNQELRLHLKTQNKTEEEIYQICKTSYKKIKIFKRLSFWGN